MKLLQLFVLMLGLLALGCEARREAEPVKPEAERGVEAPPPAEGPAVKEVEPEREAPPAEKTNP